DRVCRDGDKPGDYVQWDPKEVAYLHDWNVIWVPNGFDFEQVLAAQKLAVQKLNDQPTMIVYRTIKGWKYGIEGKGSHGAGHKFCSDAFYATMKPFEERFGITFPRLAGDNSESGVEALFFSYLTTIRDVFGKNPEIVQTLGKALHDSAGRLADMKRKPREGAPDVSKLYQFKPENIPAELCTKAGDKTTLRGALGNVLNYLNKASSGAIMFCAADLYGSTSIKTLNAGFTDGWWNASSNPGSRMTSVGGICEDAMGATMAGIAAYGRSIGAASSYGAFIAAMEHVAARLHCIGQQARHEYNDQPFNPFFIVCAHAGLKTGEDGPTHADPQPLQLFQENFPRGSAITL
ncbi:MAG: hypothetical protein Q8M07_09145, partial [Prosthecobacter sp.]|nr:hypothetical protein [Prosthecobacter sp.]